MDYRHGHPNPASHSTMRVWIGVLMSVNDGIRINLLYTNLPLCFWIWSEANFLAWFSSFMRFFFEKGDFYLVIQSKGINFMRWNLKRPTLSWKAIAKMFYDRQKGTCQLTSRFRNYRPIQKYRCPSVTAKEITGNSEFRKFCSSNHEETKPIFLLLFRHHHTDFKTQKCLKLTFNFSQTFHGNK